MHCLHLKDKIKTHGVLVLSPNYAFYRDMNRSFSGIYTLVKAAKALMDEAVCMFSTLSWRSIRR